MADKKAITLETISEQFEKDVTFTKDNVDTHIMKMGKIFKEWVVFKYKLQDKFDESIEKDRELLEKLSKEYLTGKRKFQTKFVLTQTNIKTYVIHDEEYKTFKQAQKELEKCIEVITDYYLPYFTTESFKIKEFNNYTRF